MKIASIDIGTNTVLLLICEVKNGIILPVKEQFRIPRIGRGLFVKKEIPEDAVSDLVKILLEYKKYCELHDVERIYCIGTAPFREAQNSKYVIESIKIKTGLEIKVLSEKEEALYAFLGGISNFNEFNNKQKFLVIDIGGASIEITTGCVDKIFYMRSFPIGAVKLKDRYFHYFPYKYDLTIVYNYLNKFFNELEFYFNPNEIISIAVAGTPTTISAIKLGLKEFIESKVDKTIINVDFLTKLIENLYLLSPTEILQTYNAVVKGREDVILPGAIILKYLIEKLGFHEIYVSTRGVRYGLIVKNLVKLQDFE